MEALLTKEETRALSKSWLALRNELAKNLGRKPNLQSLLFLIGVQELGQLHREFSKEEKQDLMHIAVCHLLSMEGYFKYKGKDEDGWPHYDVIKSLPVSAKGLASQEVLLKKQILKYFDK